jgi:hypothetical protein
MGRHGANPKLGIRIGHQTPFRCARLKRPLPSGGQDVTTDSTRAAPSGASAPRVARSLLPPSVEFAHEERAIGEYEVSWIARGEPCLRASAGICRPRVRVARSVRTGQRASAVSTRAC